MSEFITLLNVIVRLQYISNHHGVSIIAADTCTGTMSILLTIESKQHIVKQIGVIDTGMLF